MADEIRVSRPMSPSGRPEGQSYGNDMQGSRNNGASKLPWLVLAVIVVALVVVGVLFRDKLFSSDKVAGTTEQSSGYQAVFLTNGQVYFGKLTNADAQYAALKDIYYLQVTTPPGLQGSQAPATAAQQQQSQLSLVKLGQELHGPIDSMRINRDQILFFEDMKEDGKVMQAIREYQKNPPANTQNTQPPPGTTPPINTIPAQ